MPSGKRTCVLSTLVALLASSGAHAFALQPVDAFLRAAHSANHDSREAAATDAQRRAEVDVSRGRLYPVFSASGSYTRNQYEIALSLPGGGKPLVIQPQDQLDANLTLSVPLFDLAAIKRLGAAKAGAEASEANRRATALDVQNQVFRSYYQLLGQEAVLAAARGARELAVANLALVLDRLASGAASELDVQRGRAQIAQSEGEIAQAELAVISARRQLETLTWLAPEPAAAFLEDDLHEEAPLVGWLVRGESAPRLQLAAASRRAAAASESAAQAAWLPSLSASAQERFTNATSFSGHTAVYLLQATLAWRLDATIPASVRAQNAALLASAVREQSAARAVQDAIYLAWHQVRAAIEKARAARAQLTAARLAAELARDRYGVGAATQLDVLRAQEDAFRAEISRIQADTDIAYARAALRASAGLLHEEKP